jgi:hypothetical protein
MLVKSSGDGALFTLFGIKVNGASAWPWLVAVGVALAGGWVCRLTWPRVQAAWNDVNERFKRGALR